MTEKTFTLTVTDADLQLLAKGLEEMPFKSVAPLINKIAFQLNEQTTTPPEPDDAVTDVE